MAHVVFLSIYWNLLLVYLISMVLLWLTIELNTCTKPTHAVTEQLGKVNTVEMISGTHFMLSSDNIVVTWCKASLKRFFLLILFLIPVYDDVTIPLSE